MTRDKLMLDPYGRRMANIFTAVDLARVHKVADVYWGRDEAMPETEVARFQDRIDLIATGYWRYGDVRRFPRLRAVLEVSGGFFSPRDFDYDYAFSHGIRVLSCAPAFAPVVAEMGLGLALASIRQIAWTDRAFRGPEPNWSHTSFETEIGAPFTLYDKPVGFIGFGGLAHALKPLLAPFRCPIQVYDPWLTDAHLRSQGVTPVDLETLMATSRVIFVLAVPSAHNRGLVTGELLSLVKSDAVFVLLSRAHLVDFDALTEAVLAGRFRAAIDVYPEEPLARDHPIRGAQFAVLSSHRAGAHGEALPEIGRLVADDLEALTSGKAPWSMQLATPEYIRLRG
jgi:phosphoglycerate dehydrogenase-like enzyme